VRGVAQAPEHHPSFYHVLEELQANVAVIDEKIEHLGGGYCPPPAIKDQVYGLEQKDIPNRRA